MKIRKGTVLMSLGLLLLAAALGLCLFNLHEEKQAGEESQEIMDVMEAMFKAGTPMVLPTEEPVTVEVRAAQTPVPQDLLPSVVSEREMLEAKAHAQQEDVQPTNAGETEQPAAEPETTAMPASTAPQLTAATATPQPAATETMAPSVEATPTSMPNGAENSTAPELADDATPTPVAETLPEATPTAAPVVIATAVPEATPTAVPAATATVQQSAAPVATAAPSATPALTAAPTPVIPDYVKYPQMEMPEVEINGQAYIGYVSIPALDLMLPVMSDWSYPQLKIAPCRFYGTAYADDLIIMAHNYSSHFGNIKSLKTGDIVIFHDMADNEFVYRVAQMETIGRYDIDSMMDTEYPLTLFTCTIGGATRVTVRCEHAD